MCETANGKPSHPGNNVKTIPVNEAVGTVLAHDITEIRPGEFKGRAFRKGHIIREKDVCHLQRLGKEHLFVLNIADDEMHEDDAAHAIAKALMGAGVVIKGEPKEGKIDIIAARDGLLRVNKEALLEFNMMGDVMCATLHDNTVVKKGQTVAGTRAIPLVVKKKVIEAAVAIANSVKASKYQSIKYSDPVTLCHSDASCSGVVEVKGLRRPRAGIVITGNEVYYGRIKDAFAPVITKKIEEMGGEIVGVYYAPDEEEFISARLRELIEMGADLLITTGGMSVDPDDVTRFAIRKLGATDMTYGSAMLPGAMFLVAYISREQRAEGIEHRDNIVVPCAIRHAVIPILGIPACGMYSKTTVFDIILPRILAGEKIGRKQLAELGHSGLCIRCDVCHYPLCHFGKD
ncbi:MAG: molybdopterin binding domain protein [Nitrospirae bacterium]|nr:MAG: molybdopterin binding domain protein [Nitrospirota bacterium]